MARRWIFLCAVLVGMLTTNSQSLEENSNVVRSDIMITNSEALKRIELSKTSDSTSNLLPTPTLIQQGNNLFIKPKFILGSPFTSYKQDSSPIDGGFVTSKVLAESSTVNRKPNLPLPLLVPLTPSMILPTGVARDISIPLTRIEHQPQTPIAIPNLCQSIQCPPDIVPISPVFPQLLNSPIFVEKPARPVVIPEPPKLAPIVLPKLPIQVVIQKPLIPIPDHRIVVSSLCPPMTRCIPSESDSPSVPRVFSDVFQRFRNLLTTSTITDFTTSAMSEEQVLTSDLPMSYPTLCAQGIIAERVLPNIVTNEEIQVLMNSVNPPQLEHFNNYRK